MVWYSLFLIEILGQKPDLLKVGNIKDLPLFVSNTMSGQDHNPLKAQKAVATQAAIDAPVNVLMTKITITD